MQIDEILNFQKSIFMFYNTYSPFHFANPDNYTTFAGANQKYQCYEKEYYSTVHLRNYAHA